MIALTKKGIIKKIHEGKYPNITPIEKLESDEGLKRATRERFMKSVTFSTDLYDKLGLDPEWVYWRTIIKDRFTYASDFQEMNGLSFRKIMEASKKGNYSVYLYENRLYNPISTLVLRHAFNGINSQDPEIDLKNYKLCINFDKRRKWDSRLLTIPSTEYVPSEETAIWLKAQEGPNLTIRNQEFTARIKSDPFYWKRFSERREGGEITCQHPLMP